MAAFYEYMTILSFEFSRLYNIGHALFVHTNAHTQPDDGLTPQEKSLIPWASSLNMDNIITTADNYCGAAGPPV